LAVPQLVRFTVAHGQGGPEPTLLIKSSTLTLKYLLRMKRFRLFMAKVDNQYLAYGAQIQDDPDHPATLWSFLEYEDEAEALHTLTKEPKCFVFLFNELSVNVAWGEAIVDFSDKSFIGIFKDVAPRGTTEIADVEQVGQLIDGLHRGELAPSQGRTTEYLEVPEWHPLENYYITNATSQSLISIFESDEGRQQEEAALWLIDNLRPTGAVKSPKIQEGKKTRELTGLLLTYEHGTILIESKALGILARDTLPGRTKLANDTIKHLRKATRQRQGGVNNLRRGHIVTDPEGRELEVERTKLPHVIVLVPDLTLLSEARDFGGEFVLKTSAEYGALFHILDPSELLRVVQAAEMIAEESRSLSRIMAFDYYLMRRFERALQHDTPNFGVLFRRSNDARDEANAVA
jgi:hypothetical protein